MKSRKPFDLLRTEIAAGTTLIEASAGTGKTFTISGLVLRLLLERPDLTIDRILVTTFTELATAELRGRIRTLLRDAIAAFRSGTADDELLSGLLKKQTDHRAATTRLEAALVTFDEAPIYTIHGFCQRVLAERAFESGTLFDAELVTNQSDLLREIVEDFWRIHFYEGDRFATLLALRNKISPEKLSAHLEELIRHPALRVLPEGTRSLGEINRDLSSALTALRESWRHDEKKLRALFADGSWAKNTHGIPGKILPLLDDLARCLSEQGGTVAQLDCIESFATSTIAKRVRAGQPQPRSKVFDGCERLLELEAEFRVALFVEFFSWARAQLHERKLLRNVLSFDDLLTRLDDALAAPGGAELARSIREKYHAALIDEFQDTDPVQYSVFSRIYDGSDAPVAFIGDPKQAIYAFRGADVFTYMKAASAATRQFTLTTNWRSESRLVEAVNTIFDRPKPFLLDEIEFDRAASSPRADEKQLLIEGKQESPFHLWTADKDAELSDAIASEVVRLLTSNATIGGDPLEPRHIAVLTSTNGQAARIQKALRVCRVPSVLYSSANIFASQEARELRDVLAAVAQPGYEKFVRAALCTDALGRTGKDLDAFTRDDVAWETELLRFQKHHQTWRDRGFIQMLRQLSAEHGVRRRLLSYPDGERRLTNFLHLAELLHTACAEHRLGMNGLLKWLGQQMEGGKDFAEREEHELRLESDERAVRIITVHKSKGLEFDVVFCPYVWWFRRDPRPAFHDPKADDRLTLDLSDPKAHLERREEESLAELLRQFYVALTRARHRCTMVWRAAAKEDKSAPGYLLGSSEALPEEISPNEGIAVAPLPEATTAQWRPAKTENETRLKPREFTGTIDRSWGIVSFTRLVSGREADELDEGPPVEIATEEEEVAVDATGIHAFPRGMRAGTCLHEILELVDFSHPDSAAEIVERRLRAYSIENFDEVIAENVHALATLPLVTETDRFTLADVPNEKRIAELEFSFPIDSLTTARLAQVLHVPEVALRLDRLQFQMMNGFMNGFIDLTFEHGGRFYFADWKSNWLGANSRAYHASAIATEMQRNFYTLQLCLYSVALHRYLRLRKPDYDCEQHFGGAFYIFLRGIDPAEPKNGVYFQRLSRGFLEKLSDVFEP
ncbi:MAG TPA: exodeoxyribonuclease V subunit beta [Chthoniobacterales bacterium]